jgi:hypothetical protein
LGTITDVDVDRRHMMNTRVKWDNGRYNVYYEDDLELVEVDHLEDELFEI